MVVEAVGSPLAGLDLEEQSRVTCLPEKVRSWLEYGQLAKQFPEDTRQHRSFYNRQIVIISEFKLGDLEKLVDYLCWRQLRRHQGSGMLEGQLGQVREPQPGGLEGYIKWLCQRQARRHTGLGTSFT